MKIAHVVHYTMFSTDTNRLSVVDSVWFSHESAVRRVAWLVAQGGEATIAMRWTDDGDLELGEAEDAILAKREAPVRQQPRGEPWKPGTPKPNFTLKERGDE